MVNVAFIIVCHHPIFFKMKIVALAGGVGGAKLAHGLAQILPPENLTVIVNTGDDFEHLGLYISPDLDTVCYTLAGLANPETGWGRVNETWNAIANIEKLGGANVVPTWRSGFSHSHRAHAANEVKSITLANHA